MSYPQTRFPYLQFDPQSFWGQKRSKISSVALLYQLDVLKKTGRYEAFRLKWHPTYDEEPLVWPIPNHLFWDSDVAKWIEGACYLLAEHDDQLVRDSVDELVEMIAAAQQEDGYLNIHFTVVKPDDRFTNLRDLHELYNAGHLIEAALAHEQLCKSRKLLDPIVRYVELLVKTFGPAVHQRPGYPGHPEIELALMRLYDRTGDLKHLELARFFIMERGNPKGAKGGHYFDHEARQRGENERELPDYYPARRSYWYQQAHVPITEQTTVEGHSVRAMYLLTAVADLVRCDKANMDTAYKDAVLRLWNNMVDKKMYLTGGIGAIKQWEGFGQDYFLPQSTDEGGCYAETCASIGIVMLAERLLQIERDSRYADIMELQLYNAALTGVSCDGKSWTYVNQLASSDKDPSQRSDWFTVACCPPNVLRLLGSLGGYVYSSAVSGSKIEVNVNLFAAAKIVVPVGDEQVEISMKTDWPYGGTVHFAVACPQDVDLSLNVRIPGWARNSWRIDPHPLSSQLDRGYLQLHRMFLQAHRVFTIECPMAPRLISPHPFANQNVVAVARGPLIYCVEDVDNAWVDDHFKKTVLCRHSNMFEEEMIKDSKTGEAYVGITARKAVNQEQSDQLPRDGPGFDVSSNGVAHKHNADRDLVFVPYYFRANRGGTGHMRVGIRSS